MCMEKTDWEKVVEFHGHTCPGLAIGYRVSLIALRELAQNRAEDEDLVAIVENDACGIDAVQVLTGCTLGKGNLLYRDYGKQVFTFACRNSGKAIRISVKGDAWKHDDEKNRELMKKISSGKATSEERELFKKQKESRTQNLLNLPEEEFCIIKHIKLDLPPKAKVFYSVICAFCGETVSEARARIRDGKIACIPCSQEYTRGW